MKFGISHDSILKAYHPDGQEAFNIHGDLKIVLDMLKDPNSRLPGTVSHSIPFIPGCHTQQHLQANACQKIATSPGARANEK
jgi:hypothetical protein